MVQGLGDDEDQEQEDDISEKLLAVYGDEWKTKSAESLLDNKNFRDIPEFLKSRKKTLTCQSVRYERALVTVAVAFFSVKYSRYSALRKYSPALNFSIFRHISGFKHKDIKFYFFC